MSENIQTSLGENGVLLATIDMPGRSMNVFSEALMDAVEALLDRSDQDDGVKAVVLTSGKPAFLAGADLQLISLFAERALTESQEALNPFYGRLSRLFRRLEKSSKPYVAAINGLALGGGLELSMACHERVVVDDPQAVLGLPEIKLGLLPGAGGTQRLPALVGVETGLEMLLKGDPLPPSKALELGLVEEVVAANSLLDAAVNRALILAEKGVPSDAPRPGESQGYRFDSDDIDRQIAKRLGLSDEQLQDYPAYRAIIDCVAGGWQLGWDEAFEHEIAVFTHLMCATPVAGNMVRTMFLNLQRAGKQLKKPDGSALAIDPAIPEKLRQRLDKAFACKPLEEAVADDRVLALAGTPVGAGQCIRLIDLSASGEPGEAGEAQLFLAPRSVSGQAAEVQAQNDEARDAALGVCAALRLVPLVSSGPTLLPALIQTQKETADLPRPQQLLACALTAARVEDQGAQFDRDLADVASVVAGVMPAFSGGVFTHLKQTSDERMGDIVSQAPESLSDLFAMPASA